MFDIHCHILYDIDDGSRSLEESIAMLHAAKQVGITGMVCTPHARGSWFNYELAVERHKILSAYSKDMGMQMDLGFEVHWRKLSELGLDCASRLTLGDSNLLLLEFDYNSFPANYMQVIYKLQGMGLQVIIAHPERYLPVQRDVEKAFQLKEMGCLLQLSGNFVADGRLSARYRAATRMLKEDLIDYVASDAHRPEDYADFAKAISVARKS